MRFLHLQKKKKLQNKQLTKKLTIGVIYGGKTTEHQVSINSARTIIKNLNQIKEYEILPVYITKKGKWISSENFKFSDNLEFNKGNKKTDILLDPNSKEIIFIQAKKIRKKIDLAFPIIHGTYGEDGSLQGLLEILQIPYVGCNVLASAIGMDKIVAKQILEINNLPIAKYFWFTQNKFFKEKKAISQKAQKLKYPFFVKPANLGSSIGVTKVKDEKEFNRAIKQVFKYSDRVLVEEYIKGKEVECAILGNENPIASVIGEIIHQDEFYSYKAKYLDQENTILKIPADLSQSTVFKIQKLSIEVFKIFNCQGMARIDSFLKENGEIIINEINTIPGFTKMSMYPKLWEKTGLKFPELIKQLINLALENFNRKQSRTYNFFHFK